MESFTGAAGAGQQSRETAADSSVRLSNRTERSCLRCHQRKVRCDKKSPCASCARMGVLCSYPGPDASLRRPHRITITDVSARLSRLERMVEAMSRDYQRQGRDDQSTTTAQSPDNFEAAQEPTPQEPSSNGVLVNGGQSSRYFNEVLISRVLEEVRAILHLACHRIC